MKILISELKQIILEEIDLVLTEMDEEQQIDSRIAEINRV